MRIKLTDTTKDERRNSQDRITRGGHGHGSVGDCVASRFPEGGGRAGRSRSSRGGRTLGDQSPSIPDDPSNVGLGWLKERSELKQKLTVLQKTLQKTVSELKRLARRVGDDPDVDLEKPLPELMEMLSENDKGVVTMLNKLTTVRKHEFSRGLKTTYNSMVEDMPELNRVANQPINTLKYFIAERSRDTKCRGNKSNYMSRKVRCNAKQTVDLRTHADQARVLYSLTPACGLNWFKLLRWGASGLLFGKGSFMTSAAAEIINNRGRPHEPPKT